METIDDVAARIGRTSFRSAANALIGLTLLVDLGATLDQAEVIVRYSSPRLAAEYIEQHRRASVRD